MTSWHHGGRFWVSHTRPVQDTAHACTTHRCALTDVQAVSRIWLLRGKPSDCTTALSYGCRELACAQQHLKVEYMQPCSCQNKTLRDSPGHAFRRTPCPCACPSDALEESTVRLRALSVGVGARTACDTSWGMQQEDGKSL